MTTVNAASSATALASAQKAPGAMGQTDFLRLLTTQLTTQDPFNPVDNTQMVAQMAQFSQVAGIAEINQSLKTLVSGMGPGRIGDAAGWIGRSVLAESEVAAPLKDGSYSGEIALTEAADQVSISLVDGKGTVVHEQNLGPTTAGTIPFTWKGDGTTGPLRVVVNATAGREAVTARVATWSTVLGIQSPASGSSAQLITAAGKVAPEAALRLA